MVIAGKRSLLLALIVLSLAAPGTAAASEPNVVGHARATATPDEASFRDDRGDVLTVVLDAVAITLAGTAAIFGMTRLLPTGARPRIALP